MPVNIHHLAASAQLAKGTKRMFIKNYGCQMNEYDGARMAELLAPLGYHLTNTANAADLILLNTCHIREKADDKLFSDIGRMRRVASPTAIIGVGGCVGQAMGAAIMQQAPAVSVVFGPQTYHRLPALIQQVQSGRAQVAAGHPNAPIRAIDISFPELEKFDHLPPPGLYGPSAFVTIQEGCDKFCTYCVVPYTRGAEISRKAADILTECRSLAAQGAVEITLLGQNVNAYQDGNITLAKLLEEVAKIDGLQRLRFTTSHPNNTGADLIKAFATNPKLMPYFHLPIQAGSNRTLAAMNRNHTVESFMATVAQLRAARPDVVLSGDFIVGFPGETEEDFAGTMAVAHAAGFVGAYSFAYSPRPGTPAAQLPNQLPEALKKERLAALQALLDDNTAKACQSFIGQTLPVLIEGVGKIDGQLRGRSPHNLPVNFTINDLHPSSPDRQAHRQIEQQWQRGHIVPVHITAASPKSLLGSASPSM